MPILKPYIGTFHAGTLRGQDPRIQTLYSWLDYYTDGGNKNFLPSIELLSQQCNMSITLTKKILKMMEVIGMLKINYEKGTYDMFSNDGRRT